MIGYTADTEFSAYRLWESEIFPWVFLAKEIINPSGFNKTPIGKYARHSKKAF